MKKNLLTRTLTFIGAAALMMTALVGCGHVATQEELDNDDSVTVIEDLEVAKAFAMAYVDKYGRTELAKYDDPNGWSVFYNAAYIEPIQQDNMVAFVYTGESAGTNMITVTYNAGTNAKDAVDQMADSWKNPNTVKTESIFPGTEDTTGYRAMYCPSSDGSGLYEEVLARDYMEGNLLFEVTGHNSGNEEMDMAVSDNLAMIFDSITFVNA